MNAADHRTSPRKRASLDVVHATVRDNRVGKVYGYSWVGVGHMSNTRRRKDTGSREP